ncbi:MAG: tetratricopeptide repeat protein [bacterium]
MMRTHILLFLTLSGLLAGGCGSNSGLSDLQQGMAAFNGKNYAAAIPCFNRAAKRITDSADLYYTLGLSHLYQGELDPAQAAFNAALELTPGHSEALTCLGQIAYLQHDLSKAAACYGQALAVTSNNAGNARILTSLALSESDREHHDLARLYLLRAQKLDRLYAPALYNLASLYRDKFNLREEALDNFELYLRIVDKSDKHYEKAVNNVKRLRLNLERTQTEELDGMRRDPAAAAKLMQEGVRLQLAKQVPKAIKAYRDALAKDPLTFNAALGLATVYKSQGQRAEAMEAFKQALAINPSHQDSYFEAAELALQLKRYAEAAKILDRAIARSPFNPANAELMARIRYAETRLPEARAYGEFYLSLLRPGDKNRAAYEKWVKSLPAT